ncbi:MAG: hypothetical protein K1Y36_28405 [Blastocatellia bacterium]|nr:hypothetical protein [Blastocatellia bacterium]
MTTPLLSPTMPRPLPSATALSRLAPFVQDFVRRSGWESLRPIQLSAMQVLFDSPQADLIIAAGTASGKTEASWFPILSIDPALAARSS